MIVWLGGGCGNEKPWAIANRTPRSSAAVRPVRSALTDVPDSCYRRGGCSVNDSEEKRLWRPRPGSRVGSRVGVVRRVVGVRREQRARSRAVGRRQRPVRRPHEARRLVARRQVPPCRRGAERRRRPNEARARVARLVRQQHRSRAPARVPLLASPAAAERARRACRRPSPAWGASPRKWRRKPVRRLSRVWRRSAISEVALSSG